MTAQPGWILRVCNAGGQTQRGTPTALVTISVRGMKLRLSQHRRDMSQRARIPLQQESVSTREHAAALRRTGPSAVGGTSGDAIHQSDLAVRFGHRWASHRSAFARIERSKSPRVAKTWSTVNPLCTKRYAGAAYSRGPERASAVSMSTGPYGNANVESRYRVATRDAPDAAPALNLIDETVVRVGAEIEVGVLHDDDCVRFDHGAVASGTSQQGSAMRCFARRADSPIRREPSTKSRGRPENQVTSIVRVRVE